MPLSDRATAAYHELFAPEKDELLGDSQKLDQKIVDSSLLQNSIDKLIKKIEESRTGEERQILKNQLDELKKIHELYQKTHRINIINSTKNQINELITGITEQISSESNQLSDDTKKLEDLIENEEEKLEDTLDIFSTNTIRDLVENSIDIQGVKESIPSEQYQEFFDIVTVTYIDYLENIVQRKLIEEEYKGMIENEGLYLDNKDIQPFLNKLIERLNNKKLNLDFDFEIKLKKGLYKKNLTINLQKNIDKLKEKERIKTEAEKKEKERIEAKKAEEARIKAEKLRIQIFEENLNKLPGKARIKYIEKLLDIEEFKPYLEILINNIEGENIYLKNKQIKFDKQFILENKEKLLKNLKNIILLIIEIESDGNPKAQNSYSSASGLGQWLINDGKFTTKYYYDKKWHRIKSKLEEDTKERTTRDTSSFETTLKTIRNKYNEKILKDLEFIHQNFNKKIKLIPTDLGLRQQIKIFILSLGANRKKIKNGNGIKDFLGTAILGNSWAMKEIYKIFHHTQPDEETLKRIKKITPKYTEELITLNENY